MNEYQSPISWLISNNYLFLFEVTCPIYGRRDKVASTVNESFEIKANPWQCDFFAVQFIALQRSDIKFEEWKLNDFVIETLGNTMLFQMTSFIKFTISSSG